MKICVLRNTFKGCPPNLRKAGYTDESILYLKVGAEHEVHALSVFAGVTGFLIVDDLEMFVWLPAWLFEVIERKMPPAWIVGSFNSEPSLVIGPPLIAESLEAYCRFVEQEPEAVNAMREQIRANC